MKPGLLVLILVLSFPTFYRMLRPGIHSMHDFHPFRQFEFDICAREPVFPCRWAPDAGRGYGEPLFNFYGQTPYLFGHIFRVFGFSVLGSVKIVFIFSLVLSGLAVYLLARSWWGPVGAFLSAALYLYAPYRAVDVWVRGALPEALSFVLFPAILYCLDRFMLTRRRKYLPVLSAATALLITTHNLSAFMFLPFLAVWWFFRLLQTRFKSSALYLLPAFILSLLLSAFYLLPVAFESRLTTLSRITSDYYQYAHHFTTLNQLFISRYWGYGGSVWGPNDTLSFSVGHLQWLLPAAAVLILSARRRFRPLAFFVLTGLGLLALLLTHGKSELIWRLIPPLVYVQFPWRFLTIAVLFLSLAAGILPDLLPARFRVPGLAGLVAAVVILNWNFFRPDIWRPESDSRYFSGPWWDEQRTSALADYWPAASSLPEEYAPDLPRYFTGVGTAGEVSRAAHTRIFSVAASTSATIVFPVVDFAGWRVYSGQEPVSHFSLPPVGQIAVDLPAGLHEVTLRFTDTPPRRWGNLLTVLGHLLLAGWSYRHAKNKIYPV